MGYKTNSTALRLRANRSWRSKSFSLRKESLGFVLSHSSFEYFFDDFFNKRYFHRNGILFSHIVSTPRKLNRFRMSIFIFDPGYNIHRDCDFEEFLDELPSIFKYSDPKVSLRKIEFIKTFGIPQIFNKFNKVYIKRRRKFYRKIEKLFTHKMSKAFPFVKFSARLIPLYQDSVNATFFAKFLMMKFMYRRHVVQIVKPIIKRLLNYFGGYRIDCSGRFNRRQRASFYKFSKGSVPFNTFNAFVEYYQVSFPLKYGACSMKVWLSNRKADGRIAYEISNYYVGGLMVNRFPKHRPIFSGRSIGSIKGIDVSVPLKYFVSPYGKVKVKRLVPIEKYRIVYPFTNQFYGRRLKLFKSFLSFLKVGSADYVRRKLVRHFLRPWKRYLSWSREEIGEFRTFRRVELDEQNEKELQKVISRAPANLHYTLANEIVNDFISQSVSNGVPLSLNDSQAPLALNDEYFFDFKDDFNDTFKDLSEKIFCSSVLRRKSYSSSVSNPLTKKIRSVAYRSIKINKK